MIPAFRKILTLKAGTRDFLMFARGCEKIELYDFAIYGYREAVLKKKKVDPEIKKAMASCLKKLGHWKLSDDVLIPIPISCNTNMVAGMLPFSHLECLRDFILNETWYQREIQFNSAQ